MGCYQGVRRSALWTTAGQCWTTASREQSVNEPEGYATVTAIRSVYIPAVDWGRWVELEGLR